MKSPCKACSKKLHVNKCPKCGRSCSCYQKPAVLPRLTKYDLALAHEALGFYHSDYNTAPHEDIQKLRKKLEKLGAPHDS
jgi:hypothetical protein